MAQFFATRVRRDDDPFFVQEQHERNRFDPAPDGKRVVKALRVRIGRTNRRPRESLTGKKPLTLGGVVIQINADDLEALVPVRLVLLGDVWEFLQAGATPGGPEINQHDLALVRRPVERRAVRPNPLHHERLTDKVHSPQPVIARRGRLGRQFLVRVVLIRRTKERVDLPSGFDILEDLHIVARFADPVECHGAGVFGVEQLLDGLEEGWNRILLAHHDRVLFGREIQLDERQVFFQLRDAGGKFLIRVVVECRRDLLECRCRLIGLTCSLEHGCRLERDAKHVLGFRLDQFAIGQQCVKFGHELRRVRGFRRPSREIANLKPEQREAAEPGQLRVLVAP